MDHVAFLLDIYWQGKQLGKLLMGFFGQGLDGFSDWLLFCCWAAGRTSRPWLVKYKNPTTKMASRSWASVSSLVAGSCSRRKSMIGMDEKDMVRGR